MPIKRLALLRHAEAEPSRPDLPDAERRLNRRGRTEATEAAHCLTLAGLQVDALLLSPAVRTRETARILARELAVRVDPRLEPGMYLGSPEALWQALRHCGEEDSTVLMIGHNPGLSAFARQFQRPFHQGEDPPELRTAGLCLVEFAAGGSWQELLPGLATACRTLR